MTDHIALIIGAGAKVGHSVAEAFKATGYKVALASRSQDPETSTSTELHIPTDCVNPDDIVKAFEKVRALWGTPQVVVYNAYVHTDNNPKDIFEVPLDVFTQSNYVNMISAYVAAQETVKGWKSLSKPPDKLLTFIYTGNCANVMTLSPLVDLSVGKAGTAAFVAAAAEAYTEENFRFYYADQRLEDGSPVWDGSDPEGHAKLYIELAETDEVRPWQQTFVVGKGYKKF